MIRQPSTKPSCLRFQACCKRAYRASLALVAKICRVNEAHLDQQYRDECNSLEPWVVDEPVPEDEEEFEAAAESSEGKTGKNECENLLECIQHESKEFLAAGIEPPTTMQADEEVGSEGAEVEDFSKLPDAKDWETFLAEDVQDEHVAPDGSVLPTTLTEVMLHPGDFWNTAFRFIVYLRSAEGGSDVQWVPNARNSRKAGRHLNWHQ